MTDKINFGKGLGPISGLNPSQKNVSNRPEDEKKPVDRVDFSSVLKEVTKVKESEVLAEGERLEKLAALKEQIAEGFYKPDLEKVAGSLLVFIAGIKK